MAEEATLQWRVCWSASTNVTFKGKSEWHDANPGESEREIEESLDQGSGSISTGLETVLMASGLEWWMEFRDSEDSDD